MTSCRSFAYHHSCCTGLKPTRKAPRASAECSNRRRGGCSKAGGCRSRRTRCAHPGTGRVPVRRLGCHERGRALPRLPTRSGVTRSCTRDGALHGSRRLDGARGLRGRPSLARGVGGNTIRLFAVSSRSAVASRSTRPATVSSADSMVRRARSSCAQRIVDGRPRTRARCSSGRPYRGVRDHRTEGRWDRCRHGGTDLRAGPTRRGSCLAHGERTLSPARALSSWTEVSTPSRVCPESGNSLRSRTSGRVSRSAAPVVHARPPRARAPRSAGSSAARDRRCETTPAVAPAYASPQAQYAPGATSTGPASARRGTMTFLIQRFGSGAGFCGSDTRFAALCDPRRPPGDASAK